MATTITMRERSYRELAQIDSYIDRFNYLKLDGAVGRQTFGFERYLNQRFYRSAEWKHIRNVIIARDLGCDLGVEGYDVHDRIIIHHMNPMTPDDITGHNQDILNPDYLISATHSTHNAIHYGTGAPLPNVMVERMPGDTKLW